MANTDTEQDPSIEEILQSIREIISEDDEEGAEQEAGPEVDLTPKDDAEDKAVDLDLAPKAEDDSDDILDLTNKVEDEPDAVLIDEEPEPEIIMDDPPEPEPVPEPVSVEVSDDDLISEPAKAASIHALGKLSDNMYVEKQSHMAGITLEDITRDLMRPILKEWLDTNLPDLVERVVQQEIQKITKNMK